MADYLKLLAELAVHVGADVQPGQDVVVSAWDPIQAPVARAIVEEAYASGARYVSVTYWDGPAKASRLRHAPEDSLGFIPDWFRRVTTESVERRSAWISVLGDPNPDVFADVDQACPDPNTGCADLVASSPAPLELGAPPKAVVGSSTR